MNPTPLVHPTPQLGFDFLAVAPEATSVNRPGITSSIDFDTSNPTGIKAGDALSRMIVDDRVFRLGKTNWRILLDHAIASGHTELYLAEEGRQGLRMPGYRFGPIARMPEKGPEYVKRALLAKAFSQLQRRGEPVKSGRVAASSGHKVEWVADPNGLELNVYEGRRLAGSVRVRIDDLPVSGQPAEMDLARQAEHLGTATQTFMDAGVAGPLGVTAAEALASFLMLKGK